MVTSVLSVRPPSVDPFLRDAFPLVTTATTRRAAVAAAETADPDCVVVDGAVEDAAGIVETLRDRRPGLPVVGTTAEPDPGFALAAAEAGASRYHPRSADRPLVAELRALLGDPDDGSADPPGDGGDGAAAAGADGATGVADGAGAARATEGALPADSGAFEAIANSASEAILTIDADSRIVYANDGVESVLGYAPEALLGESLTALIPERFRAAHEEGIGRYLKTGERTIDWDGVDLPVAHADGHEIEAHISFGEFERDGAVYFTGIVRDTTERRERERELEEVRARLELALESSGAGVFEFDPVSGEVRLEPSAARIVGLGDERTDWSVEAFFEGVHPDDLAAVQNAAARAAEGEPFEVTCRFDRDGERRWLALEGEMSDAEEGQRVTGIVRDVTERERADREAERNQRALRDLQQLAADADLALDDRLDRALAIGCDRLDLPVAFLTDVDGEDLTITHARGDHPGIEPEASMPLSRTYCRRTVDEDLTAYEDVVEAGLAEDPAYADSGLRCYLGSRLTVDGDLRGTLCFAGAEPREPFTEAETTFIELLAEWVSHELERDRQRAEVAAARDRVERVLDRIDDAFFALDTDWEFTYFNGRAEEVLGVEAGAVLGECVWDVFAEAAGTQFEREYRAAMETQQPRSFESYYEPFDRWFEVSAYPAPDGLSVYFTDVTERKAYREALSSLHDTTRSMMSAATAEAAVDIATEAAEDILGYHTVVRLFDEESGVLELAAVGEETAERVDRGEVGPRVPGQGGAGQAYQRGETVHLDGEDVGPWSSSEVLVAPLDDHGTLGVGVDEPGGFTAYTRPLVELLASNLAAALDRIEREQELRTYETVLESVQDTVYVCGPDGRFSYVTEPLADLLGRDRAELVGTNLVDVLAEPDRTVGARIDQLRAGDADSVAVETTLASTTGKEIPVEIELSLYPGETFAGTVGVVRDRSELLATERALRSERDRFGYLFDNLPDAVVDVSFGDGPVVESANAAFASAFGDGERIVGRSVDDLLATDEHGEALTRAVADGETVETEVSRSTTAGTRHYLFRGIPYRTPDGDRRGFGIYTDITERERRERRLQVLNRVLRHNLRNEFSVIVGYAEQLAATLDDEDGDLAGKLAAKTHEVIDLVNRIREVGATLDRAEDAARETDVGDFLRAVVTEAGVDPPATATVEAPEGLSAAVDDRLRLAVGELVGNAVEHNEAASITVSASAEDGALVVSVADDGSGIPDHEWAVVTGEADITQLSHGSGVGLWAVRWVVDSYDGRLDRRERPDGTEIRLWLPDLV